MFSGDQQGDCAQDREAYEPCSDRLCGKWWCEAQRCREEDQRVQRETQSFNLVIINIHNINCFFTNTILR